MIVQKMCVSSWNLESKQPGASTEETIQYVTMCRPTITASSRHVSFCHYLKPEKQAVKLSGQALLQTGLPLEAAEQLPPLLRPLIFLLARGPPSSWYVARVTTRPS